MGQVVNRTRRGNGGGRLHIDGQIKRRKNDPQTSPTLRHPRRRIPVILASFFFPRKIGLNTTTDFEIIISKENHFKNPSSTSSNKPSSSFAYEFEKLQNPSGLTSIWRIVVVRGPAVNGIINLQWMARNSRPRWTRSWRSCSVHGTAILALSDNSIRDRSLTTPFQSLSHS